VGNRSPRAPHVSADGIQGALGFLDLGQRPSADDPRSACASVSPHRPALALTTSARGSPRGLEIPVRQGVTV